MRRLVLILPDLVREGDDGSPLRDNLPALRQIAETGNVFRISEPPQVETPEAYWLGLGPDEGQMRQGPLTISALGADPPERSLQFHLSLLAFQDGLAGEIEGRIPEEEVRLAMDLAKRLNTEVLTLVRGQQQDHGLVWEALGDLGTTPARDIFGKPLKEGLPEGDGERILRRYIDDSVNLLSEQEFNRRREEAGLPPLNLLWPWGHGIRRAAPNLVLRRGERAEIYSASLRLAGLARLASYRHQDSGVVGNGMNAKWETIGKMVRDTMGPVVAVIDPVAKMREIDRQEELHWLVSEVDRRLLGPLVESTEGNPTKVTILAGELGIIWESTETHAASLPFDERAFEERRLGRIQLWEAVRDGLSLVGVARG